MGTEKELTPERVMEIGKIWGDSYLKSLPVKDRPAGFKPEDIKKLKAILMKKND